MPRSTRSAVSTACIFNEDRATPVVGRMADPSRADEFVTTALGARALGWHVGQVVPMGVYTSNQFGLPGFGTPRVAPLRRIDMKLVGLVVFNNQVIEDDADRLPTDVLFTPALTRTLITSNAVQGTWYAMQLAHGTATFPRLKRSSSACSRVGATPTSGHLDHRDQGGASRQTRVDRTRRVRRDRRPGSVGHRGARHIPGVALR